MSVQQSIQDMEKPPAKSPLDPFRLTLAKHGLKMERCKTETLQINVGLLCNQACRHCHLRAGPNREENMELKTAEEVIAYAERCRFGTIDITGGAPEMNPHVLFLIENLAPLSPRLMFRSNLSVLNDGSRERLIQCLKEHKVTIVASFPALNETQTESQRGNGIFRVSIEALKKLNALGYGQEESGLELDLVSNPTGAFLPPDQAQTEKRFRRLLKERWGVDFNSLFTFANVPLGRFRDWLERSANLDKYMEKLISSFNPCAIEGLMCRSLVSVAWDGYLYDCDFNLARGIPLGGRKVHISEISAPPEPGTPIAVADHCYTCTAGSGFT
jgi:radical SAM/Cys-rich protein